MQGTAAVEDHFAVGGGGAAESCQRRGDAQNKPCAGGLSLAVVGSRRLSLVVAGVAEEGGVERVAVVMVVAMWHFVGCAVVLATPSSAAPAVCLIRCNIV